MTSSSNRSTAVTSLAPETLRSWLAGHQDLTVLDVRSAAEFESMHIRGSYNVPLPLLSEHTDELAQRLGRSRGEILAQTSRIVHGATVETNALLERKGARVALLTTKGHRDVLEMREGLKPDRYDLRSPPPEPLGWGWVTPAT